jgi:hypothetical protein
MSATNSESPARHAAVVAGALAGLWFACGATWS